MMFHAVESATKATTSPARVDEFEIIATESVQSAKQLLESLYPSAFVQGNTIGREGEREREREREGGGG